MVPPDPASNPEKDKKDADDNDHISDKQAEMEANYPYFRRFVYDKLREEFIASVPEVPDGDVEKLAREMGAEPLESFIDQIRLNGQGDAT